MDEDEETSPPQLELYVRLVSKDAHRETKVVLPNKVRLPFRPSY
jgi:hypothetical protein